MQLHVTSTIHRLSPGLDELSLRDFIEAQVRYHQPETDAKKIYKLQLKKQKKIAPGEPLPFNLGTSFELTTLS